MADDKEMLHIDYCRIIIKGLCNSPEDLLQHYYNREIEKLKAKWYSIEEIEYNLKHVLRMLKDAINHSFENSLKTYEAYKQADTNLPKDKKYYFPKPDIQTTEIIQLAFDQQPTLKFPVGRKYLLKDFESVEKALNQIFYSIKPNITVKEIGRNTLLIQKQIEPVFKILKDYFDIGCQDELLRILETGSDAKNKLLFKSNGNRFSDTFKKLFEHEMIIGWQKKELIDWIVTNFMFLNNSEIKSFKRETVERNISGKQNPCKNPIIEVEKDEVIKVDLSKGKRRHY